MSTRRIVVIASLLAAMAIAGCAHRPFAPSTAAPQAGVPAPAIDPTTPAGIVALNKRLTAHRRSLFSITQNKYSYFAGDVLLAEYEVGTEILRIKSLEPGKTDMVCEYSPRGILYVDPKAHPDKAAFTAACNQLAVNLNDDLSR